jgi:hypothetical protein
VSNLDDGQLKALLDEAITYKRPKDREGKSDLFRVSPSSVETSRSVTMLLFFLASVHFSQILVIDCF